MSRRWAVILLFAALAVLLPGQSWAGDSPDVGADGSAIIDVSAVSTAPGRKTHVVGCTPWRAVFTVVLHVSTPSSHQGCTHIAYDFTETSTDQTFSYDANDRLTSDQYDADGNTTFSEMGTDTYTSDNRLKTRTKPDGTVVTLSYDGDGNKVAEVVQGTGGVADVRVTRFLVDTNNLTGYAQTVEQFDGAALSKVYLIGLDVIAQRPVAGGVQGAVRFFGYDGHGSTRYLTDTTGGVTDTYTYDAFGILIGRTGTTDNRYLYAGEEFMPDLDMSYNRARLLDVERGRFWTRDTWEGESDDPASTHKYLYCGANPTGFIDPTGFFTSAFGYAAEREILDVYRKDHPLDDTSRSGRWTKLGKFRIDPAYSLKPDIWNKTKSLYGEIKPYTPYGLASGAAQMAAYALALTPFGYFPDAFWVPSTSTVTVMGTPTFFVNTGGLVYYSDNAQMLMEALAISGVAIMASQMKTLQMATVRIARQAIMRLSATATQASAARIQQSLGISSSFLALTRGLI